MREIIEDFSRAYEVPTEATASLLADFDALRADVHAYSVFCAQIALYESDSTAWSYQKALGIVAALQVPVPQENREVHTYALQFLFCVYLLPHARTVFQRAGISEEIFHDSMADLSYKLTECHKMYGIWGSFVAGWFERWYNASRVALGRLQFEEIALGQVRGMQEISYEKNGLRLTPESRLVNVHIPSGGHLLHSEVMDAYHKAIDFFTPRLGTRVAFVCESWLLWPQHPRFLPKNSNILDFMADYDIVASWPDDGENLWRIFYVEYHGDPDALPADSSLNRAYIAWLKSGHVSGEGVGLFVPPTDF